MYCMAPKKRTDTISGGPKFLGGGGGGGGGGGADPPIRYVSHVGSKHVSTICADDQLLDSFCIDT